MSHLLTANSLFLNGFNHYYWIPMVNHNHPPMMVVYWIVAHLDLWLLWPFRTNNWPLPVITHQPQSFPSTRTASDGNDEVAEWLRMKGYCHRRWRECLVVVLWLQEVICLSAYIFLSNILSVFQHIFKTDHFAFRQGGPWSWHGCCYDGSASHWWYPTACE